MWSNLNIQCTNIQLIKFTIIYEKYVIKILNIVNAAGHAGPKM